VLIDDLAAAYKMPPYARPTRGVFTVKDISFITRYGLHPLAIFAALRERKRDFGSPAGKMENPFRRTP
jgi:hypothetical protein